MNNFKNEPLGIPGDGYEYQKVSDYQDIYKEYIKTIDFFQGTFNYELYTQAPDIFSDNYNIKFINYGDTELVYVLANGIKKWTILLGQPMTQKGTVKKEYDILNSLAINHPDLIVKPNYYFSNQDRECYITPYVHQARCIASQNKGWGLYIPEPYYRFEKFDTKQQSLVNSCMIANLVKLYDAKNNLGIASCKIGGGDFILDKKWQKKEQTVKSTLQNMKLIAARELIQIPLNQYVELIKKEFILRTYYENINDRDKSILINHKNRFPMQREEVEKGIQLGLRLRKK